MTSLKPKLPYTRQRSHSTSSISWRQHEEVVVPQREWEPIVTSTSTSAQAFAPLSLNLGPRVDIQRALYESLPRKNSDSAPDLPLAEYISSRIYLESPPDQTSQDIHSLLGVSPKLSPLRQPSSAFSDSSSNYSQISLRSNCMESRRTSWMMEYQRSIIRMEREAMEDVIPVRSSFKRSSNRSDFQPLRSQSPSSPQRLLSESVCSAGNNLDELKRPTRPPGPVTTFSSEMTSLPEILNISKEDHDRIVRCYQSKPLPNAPGIPKAPKHHRALTIRTSDSEGKGKVHWSSTIPRRTSSLISEAKESFSRGIDEISSPTSGKFSGAFQSSKWSSSKDITLTQKDLNAPLTPYPDISPLSQNHFSSSDPPTPLVAHLADSPQTPLSSISETSPLSTTYNPTPRKPSSSSKKFGWNVRHPLKSPYPSPPFRRTKHQQDSKTPTSPFPGSPSHSPSGKFKDFTSAIKKIGSTKAHHTHDRSHPFPEVTIPPPYDPHPLFSPTSTPSPHPFPNSSFPLTSSIPSSTPISAISTQFRDFLSLKTKEERKAAEDKRIEKHREEFRQGILRKGVRVIGPLVQNSGTLHLGPLEHVSSPNFSADGRAWI